jgi:hypothetical protein
MLIECESTVYQVAVCIGHHFFLLSKLQKRQEKYLPIPVCPLLCELYQNHKHENVADVFYSSTDQQGKSFTLTCPHVQRGLL